jgi:hypothetical protein
MDMAQAKVTTDHDEIRKWAEARGGRPAAVRSTHSKEDPGIIRIEFPDAPNARDENLVEISWDARGEPSYFYKIIGGETAEAREHGETHASRHHGRR